MDSRKPKASNSCSLLGSFFFVPGGFLKNNGSFLFPRMERHSSDMVAGKALVTLLCCLLCRVVEEASDKSIICKNNVAVVQYRVTRCYKCNDRDGKKRRLFKYVSVPDMRRPARFNTSLDEN
jgi:hypothetical protein